MYVVALKAAVAPRGFLRTGCLSKKRAVPLTLVAGSALLLCAALPAAASCPEVLLSDTGGPANLRASQNRPTGSDVAGSGRTKFGEAPATVGNFVNSNSSTIVISSLEKCAEVARGALGFNNSDEAKRLDDAAGEISGRDIERANRSSGQRAIEIIDETQPTRSSGTSVSSSSGGIPITIEDDPPPVPAYLARRSAASIDDPDVDRSSGGDSSGGGGDSSGGGSAFGDALTSAIVGIAGAASRGGGGYRPPAGAAVGGGAYRPPASAATAPARAPVAPSRCGPSVRGGSVCGG